MKIGDKVRFLNTIGGGVVKGFQGKDIVLVEDTDGFDIPVLIREVVVIEPAHDIQVRQTVVPTPQFQQNTVSSVIEEPGEVVETREGEVLSVYLAYLPVDIKSLSTTSFECYLVNDSNYYLSFNYMSRSEGGWFSRSVGQIEPNTKIFLEEFGKEVLNDIEQVCLQFIAYKQGKAFQLKNSYSVDLRIDTVKFYKLHSFKENDYFDEEAIMYTVVKRDLATKELAVSSQEIEMAMKEKTTQRPRKEAIVKKPKKEILEIDLHIHELLDNTNGLSPADILEYQIGKFKEVMDENIRSKGKKIVFIHGKGDGILRNALLKELKTNYKSVYFQDASFREYGYGATMVTIK